MISVIALVFWTGGVFIAAYAIGYSYGYDKGFDVHLNEFYFKSLSPIVQSKAEDAP